MEEQKSLVAEMQQVRQQVDKFAMVKPNQAAALGEAEEIRGKLADIQQKSKNPSVVCEAFLTSADLSFFLAGLQIETDAATRQTPLDNDRLAQLQSARDLYQQVLTRYPNFVQAKWRALLGLGDVAESLNDWDQAQKCFSRIIDGKEFTESSKDLAKYKIRELVRIAQPALIGPLARITTTRSSTMPGAMSTTLPTGLPESHPATMPENPALAPSAPGPRPTQTPAPAPLAPPVIILPAPSSQSAVPLVLPSTPTNTPSVGPLIPPTLSPAPTPTTAPLIIPPPAPPPASAPGIRIGP